MRILLQNFPRGYLILIIALVTFLAIAVNIQFHTKHTSDVTTNEITTKNLVQCNTTELYDTASKCLADPIIEDWQKITVKAGDNLSTLFKRIGLTPQDVYQVSKAIGQGSALDTLFPGDELQFIITNNQLQKIRHIKSPLESLTIIRSENAYHAKFEKRQPDIRTRFVKGVINESLFVDGQKAGLSKQKLIELTTIFGWDIDFALDIRSGDIFTLMYEEKYLDDELIGSGNIIAAQFVNQNKVHAALRHTDGKYYTPQGHSMQKAFLRSPVEFYRISSKFNPKRLHPIFKTLRPHRGVDYAAATGTPIRASGDGRVIWRGNKKGYGRTIIIQHAGVYTTLYAHMSRYNSKVKQGSRVKQGQVIGYVGTSGYATGPHLHYEFRVNGVHKDPLKVKFPHTKPLSQEQLKQFSTFAATALMQLNTYQMRTPVASNL